MEKHYLRWADSDLVSKFSQKKVDDFFSSERWALDQTEGQFDNVLDIGCASGRMIELLRCYSTSFIYTGIDIIPENIELARSYYPEFHFYLCNGLGFKPEEQFDLVNATGVCQHEPHYEELLSHMVSLSKKYVMFDVKLAPIYENIADLEQSYCRVGDKQLFFVLFAANELFKFLQSIPDICQIDILGYETQVSSQVHLPYNVTQIVSAGVFIKKGKGPLEFNVELPDWLVDNTNT